MYLKLACKNVRRSTRDFFIYFLTLTVSVYLLYTFNSLDGWKNSVGLTELQQEIFFELSQILKFFSAFTIVVFAFLIYYANRFLIRRRKMEFGIYRTLGMSSAAVSRLLVYETVLVGAAALALGLAAGIVLSPLFGLLTSSIFRTQYHFRVVADPFAIEMTLLCFAAIFLIVLIGNLRMLRKQRDIDLIHGPSRRERFRFKGRFSSLVFFAASILLLSVVYYVSMTGVEFFVVYLLPLGVAACLGTLFFFRFAAASLLTHAQTSKRFYYRRLHLFVLRQVDSRINSNYRSVATVCVLLTISICMFSMAIGSAFTMTEDLYSQQIGVVPIFIGMYFGIVFMIAGAAILSLQQLSQAVDSRQSYRILRQIGTSAQMQRGSVTAQNGIYFGLPMLLACIHSVFGIRLISSLMAQIGDGSFQSSIAVWIFTPVLILVIYGIYFLITNLGCRRLLIPREQGHEAA